MLSDLSPSSALSWLMSLRGGREGGKRHGGREKRHRRDRVERRDTGERGESQAKEEAWERGENKRQRHGREGGLSLPSLLTLPPFLLRQCLQSIALTRCVFSQRPLTEPRTNLASTVYAYNHSLKQHR